MSASTRYRKAEAIRSQATAVFYWDCDFEVGGQRSLRNPRSGVGYLESEGIARLLDILEEFRVKAAFAFVGYAALPGELPHHAPQQVAKVQRRGHEVACHAWQHEWLAGLDHAHLVRILRQSRDALENASGSQVVSFVPPWNAPSRWLSRGSLGLGQFRYSWRDPTDLPALCTALCEVGFRTCRASFEPLHWMLWRRLTGHRLDFSPQLALILNSILCLRVNTPGGFGPQAEQTLERTARQGGVCVLWAHPHSLLGDGKQGERALRPLLQVVSRMRDAGRLNVLTPRAFLRQSVPAIVVG
jgi:hypothetical protein